MLFFLVFHPRSEKLLAQPKKRMESSEQTHDVLHAWVIQTVTLPRVEKVYYLYCTEPEKLRFTPFEPKSSRFSPKIEESDCSGRDDNGDDLLKPPSKRIWRIRRNMIIKLVHLSSDVVVAIIFNSHQCHHVDYLKIEWSLSCCNKIADCVCFYW